MDKKKLVVFVVLMIFFVIAILYIIEIIKISKKSFIVGNNIKEETYVETDNSVLNENKEQTTVPTDVNTKSTSPSPTSNIINSTNKYYIKVNTEANTVTIYEKDVNGNYTVPIKAMICSTGNATPKNCKFKLKGKWNWGPLFGGVYGQYISHITGDILFHSVPYLKKNDYNSLEYWEYDKLGTTCSAGCVRLTVEDALWIYNNCPTGTTVEFYSSSNPGPLGKPSAQKISDNIECRGWDPTDPNPNNPWINTTTEQSSETFSNQTPEVIPTQKITEELIEEQIKINT